MKRSHEIKELFLPWAGLVVGIAAAGIVHQFGSEGAFVDCAAVVPAPLLIVALLGMAAALGGAWLSWRVARNRSEGSARRLIAIVSVGSVTLLLMATLLPMVASLVIPQCFA